MNIHNEIHDPMNDSEKVDRFTWAYQESRKAMSEAAISLHNLTANVPMSPEGCKRLDGIHKQMVRLIREWNRLEQVTGLEGSPVLAEQEGSNA